MVTFPTEWKNKFHVPNHQSVVILLYYPNSILDRIWYWYIILGWPWNIGSQACCILRSKRGKATNTKKHCSVSWFPGMIENNKWLTLVGRCWKHTPDIMISLCYIKLESRGGPSLLMHIPYPLPGLDRHSYRLVTEEPLSQQQGKDTSAAWFGGRPNLGNLQMNGVERQIEIPFAGLFLGISSSIVHSVIYPPVNASRRPQQITLPLNFQPCSNGRQEKNTNKRAKQVQCGAP